jgi:hypothetical protein
MKPSVHNSLKDLVGAPRFELGTSCAQGRRATRLRYAPTVNALFILKHLPTLLLIRVGGGGLSQNCAKYFTESWLCQNPTASLAWRFIFTKASRFICNFICEYFLKTLASPCLRSCVTHSSATPPALSRVLWAPTCSFHFRDPSWYKLSSRDSGCSGLRQIPMSIGLQRSGKLGQMPAPPIRRARFRSTS